MPSRREILQTLVASVGAGAVVPGLADDQHIAHLASAAGVEQADAKSKAAAYKPEFLDQHQFETLQALAERIVPGAARAKTSEFIDQLLAVDSPDDQRAFMSALGAMEGQALDRAKRPWKQLAEAEQIAILKDLSTMDSGQAAARPWTKGDPIDTGREPSRPPVRTLRDHFDLLKSWIAGAYYSSEIGMRELGWTGKVVFDSFPGCEHPGSHV